MPSSSSLGQSIAAELSLAGRPLWQRLLVLSACVGGLVLPLWLLQQKESSRCVLSQQLLVSDPLTKGKSELSSGLELLGLAGKTDDPTLKAVLESRSVSDALTRQLRKRHSGDQQVISLADRIDRAEDTNRNDSPLQVKQKRGDRFQDLSIIAISVRGTPEVLQKIRGDIRSFYQDYGLIYRYERTTKASAFADAQINRLRRNFETTDRSLQAIRNRLGGFDPDSVLSLAKENYARLTSALTEARIEEPQGFINGGASGSSLTDLIASNGLQPVVTSDAFKKLVSGYNSIKARYLLLKKTRPAGDEELNAITDRLQDLGDQIREQLKGVAVRPEAIPSTRNAYDAFEKEVITKSKLLTLQNQSEKDKRYYSELAARAQALQSSYGFLIEEQKSTLGLLSTYRQLKEKLLLDSAKELSSWSIIDSSLQCEKLASRSLQWGLAGVYLLLILLMLSPSLRGAISRRAAGLGTWLHGG
ncbi:MAG: hypothetical protein VKK62_01905 [Synechococcaceae cyanobacterium]|nr:hypothetical protein [Synechococcaceae cyanobacterium]